MKHKLQLILKSAIVILLLLPAIALAEVNVNGKSSQNYESAVFSSGPSDDFRKASIAKAKNAAWEKYTQGFSPSKTKSYRQIETSVLKNIDEYLIEVNVIDEKVDEDAKRYTVIVRATINTAKFDAKLSEISTAGSQLSGSGSLFSFIFVARQEDSIKSFDEKHIQIKLSLEQESFKRSSIKLELGAKKNDLERINSEIGPLISEKKMVIRPIEEIDQDILIIAKKLLNYLDVDDSILVEKEQILTVTMEQIFRKCPLHILIRCMSLLGGNRYTTTKINIIWI